MKRDITILREELKRADTMQKMDLIIKKIESKFFELESQSEVMVMKNNTLIKWRNLYDSACEKKR